MRQHDWRLRTTFVAVCVLCLAGHCTLPARAADLKNVDAAVKWLPADAAFYSGTLRAREQINIVVNSKAWAKLKSLPLVQQGLQMLQAQLKNPPDPQLAQVLQMLHAPENKELLDVLADMGSNEIFFYGGSSFTDFLELFLKMANSIRFAGINMASDVPPEKLVPMMLLQAASKHQGLIKIPDIVIGFKLSKSQSAETQLKRLEALINAQLQQAPPQFKQMFKRVNVGGGSFLNVTVDAAMLPWDQISAQVKELEQKEGEFGPLMMKLKGLKFSFSMGVREGYFLMAFGGSTAAIENLGKGQHLIDRPEFAKLAKHADQRLIQLDYVSGDFRTRMASNANDFSAMTDSLNKLLPLLNLPDDQQARIKKDLAALGSDMAAMMPKLGSALSYAFLTSRGQEGFSYDWSEARGMDASQPLTLLNHVGGNPLLAVVGRAKYNPQGYETFVKYVKKAYAYVEELAVPRLGAEERAKYDQVMKIVVPLFTRLDHATGKMFLPGFADSQTAFVLDGKLKSKQWHQALPSTGQDMPMLEPAIVLGVSDEELVKKAFGEYRGIFNELITKLHELDQNIQDIQIPEPEVKKESVCTLYFYPLPPLGQDPQLAPTASLSAKVAALTFSHSHALRIQTSTPLRTEGGPLADLMKPSSGAVYCNWAGFVDVISPWVEFGVKTALAEAPQGAPPAEVILQHVRVGLEVLKTFRSYSSRTYLEDKVLVTHSETIMKDVD